MFDLETIRAAISVGAGVAQLVGQIVAHVHAVKHDPEAIGTLLDDVAEKVPDIIGAVKSGTVAAFEPTVMPADLGTDAGGAAVG